MNPVRKKILLGLAAVGTLAALSVGIYAYRQVSAFDTSMAQVYSTPLPNLSRSTDPAVVARGKHLVESLGACATRDCHSSDLGGGKTLELGPLGTLSAPNITAGGFGGAYSDGELARLLRFGIKRDGRSVRMMPVQDFAWLPDSDVIAMISYLRTVPSVDRPSGPMVVKPLAKILDRRNEFIFDVARRLVNAKPEDIPAPAPSAAYGAYVARLCSGCHGERLSGGPIPGAPPSLPIPLNITPHESGIKDWTYPDFEKLITAGVRKNGQKLNPFMPIEAFAKLDETERRALWAYLQTIPPLPYGQR